MILLAVKKPKNKRKKLENKRKKLENKRKKLENKKIYIKFVLLMLSYDSRNNIHSC